MRRQVSEEERDGTGGRETEGSGPSSGMEYLKASVLGALAITPTRIKEMTTNAAYNLRQNLIRKKMKIEPGEYASLFGKKYRANEEQALIKRFQDILWISYRKKEGLEKGDVGWGCMIRVVQMLFAEIIRQITAKPRAHVLAIFSHPKPLPSSSPFDQLILIDDDDDDDPQNDYLHPNPQSTHSSNPNSGFTQKFQSKSLQQNKEQIKTSENHSRQELDQSVGISPEEESSFIGILSLERICEYGNIEPRWTSFLEILSIVNDLLVKSIFPGTNAKNRLIIESFHNGLVLEEPNTYTETQFPRLTVLSCKIALEKLPIHSYITIRKLMEQTQFVGCIGGVNGQALYLLGYFSDEFAIYLDPHYVSTGESECVCRDIRGINFSSLSPSLNFVYLCHTRDEFLRFGKEINEISKFNKILDVVAKDPFWAPRKLSDEDFYEI